MCLGRGGQVQAEGEDSRLVVKFKERPDLSEESFAWTSVNLKHRPPTNQLQLPTDALNTLARNCTCHPRQYSLLHLLKNIPTPLHPPSPNRLPLPPFKQPIIINILRDLGWAVKVLARGGGGGEGAGGEGGGWVEGELFVRLEGG